MPMDKKRTASLRKDKVFKGAKKKKKVEDLRKFNQNLRKKKSTKRMRK